MPRPPKVLWKFAMEIIHQSMRLLLFFILLFCNSHFPFLILLLSLDHLKHLSIPVCFAVCGMTAQKWHSLGYQSKSRWYYKVPSKPNDSMIIFHFKNLKQKHLFEKNGIENFLLLCTILLSAAQLCKNWVLNSSDTINLSKHQKGKKIKN